MSSKISSLQKMSLLHKSLRGNLSLLVLALGSMGFAFAMLALTFYQYDSARMVPYIVTVDRQGVVLSSGAISPDYTVPGSVIASTLSDFISNIRGVSNDRDLQTRNIYRAYAHLIPNSTLEHKVRSFYESNNPFEAVKKYTRSVQVLNVISQSERTMQVDFTEHTRSDFGTKEKKMRALISYELGMVPNDPNTLLQNPLGIYVSDYVLSEVIS